MLGGESTAYSLLNRGCQAAHVRRHQFESPVIKYGVVTWCHLLFFISCSSFPKLTTTPQQTAFLPIIQVVVTFFFLFLVLYIFVPLPLPLPLSLSLWGFAWGGGLLYELVLSFLILLCCPTLSAYLVSCGRPLFPVSSSSLSVCRYFSCPICWFLSRACARGQSTYKEIAASGAP